MKVLQINANVNFGSTGRITEDIGSILIENGHESFIAYGRGNPSSKSQLIKIGDFWDIYAHGLKTVLLDRHGFGSSYATKQLLLQVERIKPDLVGLHNLHGYYLNIEILFNYLKKLDIPVVWTLHDTWSFTGHCTFFDSVGCEKWKTTCSKCPKTRRYPSSYFMDQSRRNFEDKRRVFNHVNKLHFVTPSYWLSEKVRQSFLSTYPLNVIPNGVDLNVFQGISNSQIANHKSRYGISKSKRIILGVANIWDKRKGLGDFIKLRKFLGEAFHFVLIGLNPSQIQSLPSGILGIRRTDSVEELKRWYSSSDVFINPTYQDNFPTTNIEALACGTPVITYDTGGSPEAINPLTGIVVKKGDFEGLLSAIEKLLSKNKDQVKADCRVRAERLFNKNERYLDYLNLYESLVN
ncbi:glycosyltransferase [Cyclobacterium xiamenense]|uniref:glycosyltransferase n=1 Tax=Cyclobacterium xiamenense TaxID=1297121 RepID=UPI0012B9FD72|nr:glycosyltransferase [Cyclobacterium xiamenense]